MLKHPHIATWDIQRIAGEARLDARTVRLVMLGDSKCSPRSRQLVLDAVARLNLTIAVPSVVDSSTTRIRST